ncbi:MAG: hypothetical protein AAF674_22570 [Pseudomonadota bacterium]
MTETKDVPAWAKRLKSKWTAISGAVAALLIAVFQFIEQIKEILNAL